MGKKKANSEICQSFLDKRTKVATVSGYPKPRYVAFAEYFLELGFKVHLYEAQQTESKYITVKRGNVEFKVRFSAHKPIKTRERNRDCDFFVGRTNYGVTNTAQAIKACKDYFVLKFGESSLPPEVGPQVFDMRPINAS